MQDGQSLLESHEILKTYIAKKSVGFEDEGVYDYLRDIKYSSITDFPKGCDWFNVSEELSFTNQLKGKIVLLDFFTYCCINCMHLLPDLKEIEERHSMENGLVIIGVHSAKFPNEKYSDNILAAIQRYNISHPVVNDSECFMWKSYDVQCWPTLLLLGPNGNPIVMLMGESCRKELQLYVLASLSFYASKGELSLHKIPVNPAYHFLPALKGALLFPGKITCSNGNSEILAISDTSNHRILVINNNGTLLHQVGGGLSGFKDGSLNEALFSAPQGLVFSKDDILFVADTENHVIRKIDLKCGTVTTVAGVGEQGEDYKGGRDGALQEISSPWDIVLYRTSELKEMLFIAMAGTHQIWALFLDAIVWWKNEQYAPGTCICIAGSGREENRNNQYPHAAGFAQPSGLTVCNKNKELYIADSESSSIRRLSLVDGKVTPVVGGDKDPHNLFAYGDKDGKLYDAKLQHVLGLTISKDEDYLYIADTYNHKIKEVNIMTNSVSTLVLEGTFNEPGGLCMSLDGRKLYIADTNNHSIKIIYLDNEKLMHTEQLNLKLDKHSIKPHINKDKLEVISVPSPVYFSCSGGKLIIKILLGLSEGLKLSEDAPQSWRVDLPNTAWSCAPFSCDDNVINTDIVVSIPPVNENVNLDFIYNLILCTPDRCLSKNFIIRLALHFNENSPLSSELALHIEVDKDKIIIKNTCLL